MKISVILPTWNEGKQIGGTLKRLRGLEAGKECEVIVVDGGSKDETVASARRYANKVIPLGGVNRGAQLHKGASAATGDYLLFLHSDSQLPATWRHELGAFWESEAAAAAAATVFSVDYGRKLGHRFAALGQNLRVSLIQSPRGNAGLCVPRAVYEDSGGYPEIPMMEDAAFSKRLKAFGRIVRLSGRIRPAARHMHKDGPMRAVLRQFWIRTQYSFGASPDRLWRVYGKKRLQEVPGVTDGEDLLKDAVRGKY